MNSYALVNQYMKEAEKFSRLTQKQEKELSRRISKGDESAKTELIEANLKLVVFLASKYRHKGVDLADLISEGNVGLVRAAQTWKNNKDSRFSTYAAFYIRKHIMQCIDVNKYPVNIPINMSIASNSLKNKLRKYENEGNGVVTDREIKKMFGKTFQGQSVESILSNTRITSCGLTKKNSDNEDIERTDKPLTTESFLREFENADSQKKLKAILHKIISKTRYGHIIKQVYGFDGQQPITFEDLGKLKGVSGQSLRDKRNIVFNRIRRQYKKEDFLDFITS